MREPQEKGGKVTKTLEPQVLWTNQHLEYLDNLREGGTVNMLGAGVYLKLMFNLSKADARKILLHWINTFGERHREERQ